MVLHVARKERSANEAGRDTQSKLDEAVALTAAIHLHVVEALIAPVSKPTPA